MSSDHKLLWQQVQNLAKDDRAVARARDALSDLFEVAKRGKFELANKYSADGRQIAQALTSALRLASVQVAMLPIDAADPLDPKIFTGEEICSLRQGFKLGAGLWEALWDKFNWARKEAFRLGPGEAARKRFEQVLRLTVGRPIEEAVWKTLERSPHWKNQRACIANGIWDAMLCYLSFVALGDKARASRLEPLVKLLPRIMFVCARNEALESWLVLIG